MIKKIGNFDVILAIFREIWKNFAKFCFDPLSLRPPKIVDFYRVLKFGENVRSIQVLKVIKSYKKITENITNLVARWGKFTPSPCLIWLNVRRAIVNYRFTSHKP